MPSNLYYFDPCAASENVCQVGKNYRLVPIARNGAKSLAWDTPAVLVLEPAKDNLALLQASAPKSDDWRIICLVDGEAILPAKLNSRIFAVLPRNTSQATLAKTVEKAFESLRDQEAHHRTRKELKRAVADLETLNNIGMALSTERKPEALLELILSKSREVTSADAGSLYLAKEDEKSGVKHLVFQLTQNDSHSVPFSQFRLDIDTTSISGYAAATGNILNIKDAYRIRNLPFKLNRGFDEKFGYRTKSMMVIPMKNQKDEVIGVLQLINSKKRPGIRLTSPKIVREEVQPFSRQSQDLASSLASQAAVALENNILYHDIEKLFAGFVEASVTAIESRDPTTFGHSKRVAKLTVALAETVDSLDSGPYKDIHFSREDIREIQYASILHDFGKVGVPEEVLVKAEKLYPSQLELVKKRFQYVRKALELESYRKKVDYLLANGNQGYEAPFAAIDSQREQEARNLDEFMEQILEANKPTVLPEKISEKLVEIAGWRFDDPSGITEPLLTAEELQLLSITKGSLNPYERLQIESHVIHSFRFLKQIPWTKELQRIPDIVSAHHEKLDGSGYPYKMKSHEIPFQAKIMTIADIFDALTARDRPYKRAVPVDRALNIIGDEVKSELLDPVLFHLFVDAKIFQLTAND